MSATQYDPNKLGWGAAVVTVVFTAALGFGAYTIHKNTYRHPRDPMNMQVYHAEDQAKASGGHEAAAGGAEHGAAAEGAKAEGSHEEPAKEAPAAKH